MHPRGVGLEVELRNEIEISKVMRKGKG